MCSNQRATSMAPGHDAKCQNLPNPNAGHSFSHPARQTVTLRRPSQHAPSVQHGPLRNTPGPSHTHVCPLKMRIQWRRVITPILDFCPYDGHLFLRQTHHTAPKSSRQRTSCWVEGFELVCCVVLLAISQLFLFKVDSEWGVWGKAFRVVQCLRNRVP